jgi:two-component system response regulator DevR
VRQVRVLLVDDHEVVRLGLMTLINEQDDMVAVGEAGSAAEALGAAERLRPDVVVMDIRLPGEGGIEVTRLLSERYPETRVVMLTSYIDDDLLVRSIRAGAAGYVLKQVGTDELLRAVRAAAQGEAVIDPATTSRLFARVREIEERDDRNAFRELSPRELDVLGEVARGMTNAEIGQSLNLREKTVRNYVSRMLEKLGLSNRIELATYAVEHHLTDASRTARGSNEP